MSENLSTIVMDEQYRPLLVRKREEYTERRAENPFLAPEVSHPEYALRIVTALLEDESGELDINTLLEQM